MMSDGQESGSFLSLWRNLKRALVSKPDLQTGSNTCVECGLMSSSNFSNSGGESVLVSSRAIDNNADLVIKRQRLNIVTEKIDPREETSFMEVMKNLLSCSICLEVNSHSNQCPNGHLICITCSGRLQQTIGELNCPVCRISLKQGLHRSLLAEQLTSELPAACRYCSSIMPVKSIKNHEANECSKRMVACKYKMFGCPWIGIEEVSNEHIEACSISNKTVGLLHDIVSENVTKDIQLLQVPLQLWRAILSKLKTQSVGSRMMIRQTSLHKSNSDDVNQTIFRSLMIRVPFSCCNLHGFYIDIFVNRLDENDSEKFHYVLKSENRTKIALNFYLVSMKINESINVDVQDSLHMHLFESSHKESSVHEFKLLSLDCEKELPKLWTVDSLLAEICFISERERSEKSHGILNSNEEEETNQFLSTGSDSNVVFTLFSPSTSGSRSVNTSNAIVSRTERTNVANETEPFQEEDIVITVMENVDNGEDISGENRDNFLTRNNHSFVAVPSVFINPTAPIFSYSPFQIDNSFMNNPTFQQPSRIQRDGLPYEHSIQQQQENHETEIIRLQSNNGTRDPANDPLIQPHINRTFRDPPQISLFYPPQAVVSPYITNSVSPIAIRPTTSQNLLLRPHMQPNALPFRIMPIISSSEEINLLNSMENTNNDIGSSNINNEVNEDQANIESLIEEISAYTYPLNESVSRNDVEL